MMSSPKSGLFKKKKDFPCLVFYGLESYWTSFWAQHDHHETHGLCSQLQICLCWIWLTFSSPLEEIFPLINRHDTPSLLTYNKWMLSILFIFPCQFCLHDTSLHHGRQGAAMGSWSDRQSNNHSRKRDRSLGDLVNSEEQRIEAKGFLFSTQLYLLRYLLQTMLNKIPSGIHVGLFPVSHEDQSNTMRREVHRSWSDVREYYTKEMCS